MRGPKSPVRAACWGRLGSAVGTLSRLCGVRRRPGARPCASPRLPRAGFAINSTSILRSLRGAARISTSSLHIPHTCVANINERLSGRSARDSYRQSRHARRERAPRDGLGVRELRPLYVSVGTHACTMLEVRRSRVGVPTACPLSGRGGGSDSPRYRSLPRHLERDAPGRDGNGGEQ